MICAFSSVCLQTPKNEVKGASPEREQSIVSIHVCLSLGFSQIPPLGVSQRIPRKGAKIRGPEVTHYITVTSGTWHKNSNFCGMCLFPPSKEAEGGYRGGWRVAHGKNNVFNSVYIDQCKLSWFRPRSRTPWQFFS